MNKSKKIIIGSLLALAIVITGGFFVYQDFQTKRTVYNNTIAGGVYYNGESVAGKSISEMKKIVLQQEQALKTPISLQVPSGENTQTVLFAVDDLNWTANTKETLDELIKANHSFVDSNYSDSNLLDDFKAIYFTKVFPQKNIELKWTYDVKKLETNMKKTVKKYNIPAQNAKVLYGKNPTILPEKPGYMIDEEQAIALVKTQLEKNVRTAIVIPGTTVLPKVPREKLPRIIFVSRAKRTIRLFDNTGELIKTYRCAVGQPAWPTPRGDFRVVTKQKNASWYNPHSAWSRSMPDVIGPGPSNPMGVRKIGINSPGIFMHGIPRSEFSSIGHAASHGCMRMLPKDVADLYGRVQIGTLVFIR